MPSFLECGLVTIQATIGVSSAYRDYCAENMERHRPDKQARALIDTGAQSTIVNMDLLDGLQVSAKDETSVMGIHGNSKKHPVFDVWLKVINKSGDLLLESKDLRVVGMPLGTDSYAAILGMDVLGTFTLQFLRVAQLAHMTETVLPGEGI